jgi:hypothetical protein
MRRTTTVVGLSLTLIACGGGATEPEAESAESSGSEAAPPATPIEAAPEAEASPDPGPTSGPSQVSVTATVNRQPVPAHVRLVAADGSTAAEGEVGTKLDVPSGTYTLEVAVTDAKALADKPTEKREVTLLPGGDTTEVVDFAWSKIKLNVRVNGTLDPKAVVRLLRKGAVVAEIQSASDHVMISPGRYGAKVKPRGTEEIEVDELMVPQGATRETPVNVVTGQ